MKCEAQVLSTQLSNVFPISEGRRSVYPSREVFNCTRLVTCDHGSPTYVEARMG